LAQAPPRKASLDNAAASLIASKECACLIGPVCFTEDFTKDFTADFADCTATCDATDAAVTDAGAVDGNSFSMQDSDDIIMRRQINE